MAEEFMTVKEFAAVVKVSASTIYRNPLKYNMFRVGGSWRANKESLESFSHKVNNAIRLAVVGGKESKKCRYSKEVKNTGLISPRQTDRELGDLLAPRKK
jgi:hypothetical protein